jgi:5-methylcytosine-specific restriction enzyme A
MARHRDHGKRVLGRRGVVLRRLRLERSNGLCEDCLMADPPKTRSARVVDHIVPIAHGGKDEDSNTRNLCHDCHQARTAQQFNLKERLTYDETGFPPSWAAELRKSEGGDTRTNPSGGREKIRTGTT